MRTVTGPSGSALMTLQASKRVRPCTAVPAKCKISSPGWTVSVCPKAAPGRRNKEIWGVQVTGEQGTLPIPATKEKGKEHSAPLKIRLMVRGLSPCREPFPPSRLKPSPAVVFSSVTVWTAASAVEEGMGSVSQPCSSGHVPLAQRTGQVLPLSERVSVSEHRRVSQAAHRPGHPWLSSPPGLPPHQENLLDSAEASLAPEAEATESVEELRSGAASGVGFLVTITACLGSRAWRRMASASLWVAPLRDLPLMERTSLPFWIVPSWEASPLGNTL